MENLHLDANPFAQQVRKLYDMGIINTVSVGFISTQYDRATSTSVKQQLLELSFVPVPANQDAVRLNPKIMSTLGLNKELLVAKGITLKTGDEETTPVMEEVVEVVETPAEVIAEKGGVADELAEDEMNEAKYSKLDEFFEAIWAFVDVYMDPETGIDQFDTLVAELVGILQDPNTYTDDEMAKSIVKSIFANRKSGK